MKDLDKPDRVRHSKHTIAHFQRHVMKDCLS